MLYALGEDPGIVIDEMGHTDRALALRIYRQAMRRDDGERERLRALVDGVQTADGGSRASDWQLAAGPLTPRRFEIRLLAGPLGTRPAGFEPATFRSGGGRSIP